MFVLAPRMAELYILQIYSNSQLGETARDGNCSGFALYTVLFQVLLVREKKINIV